MPQQVETDAAFSVRRENELPRVAAVCHMVRGVQSDDVCESRHEQKVPPRNRKRSVCARFSPGFPFIGKEDRLFLFMLCKFCMKISTIPLAIREKIVQPPKFELVG